MARRAAQGRRAIRQAKVRAQKERALLGDQVEKVIKVATLGMAKPCGGCQKRKARLNQWDQQRRARKAKPKS